MKTAAQTTFAERLGRMLGQSVASCAHLDRRARAGCFAQGWAPGARRRCWWQSSLPRSVALCAFWLALLIVLLVGVGLAQRRLGRRPDFLGRKAE